MTTPYVDPNTISNPTIGQPITAAWGDTVNDDIKLLAQTPSCRVRNQVAQATANTTFLYSAFPAADIIDTDSFHNPSTNNTRITVPAGLGGIYRIDGYVEFQPNATGYRLIGYRINGSTLVWTSGVVSAGGAYETRLGFSEETTLAAGSYIELVTMQSSGGALNVTDARFAARWVSV